jgi:hypothetical protein
MLFHLHLDFVAGQQSLGTTHTDCVHFISFYSLSLWDAPAELVTQGGGLFYRKEERDEIL